MTLRPAVFSRAVWGVRPWVRARAPLSAVFLPLAPAGEKLLQDRTQSPGQEEGRHAGSDVPAPLN